jgi:mitochondrial fission protein ELM1
VTPSRRTPPELSAAIEAATRGRPRLIWDGTGDNPYPDILAHADAFIVTGDSVNMTGEACATGCPVYVFQPGRGSAKFQRFHDGLRRHGATRALPETLSRIEVWTYAPLHSAEQIAVEIERRWLNRLKMLGGIIHSTS